MAAVTVGKTLSLGVVTGLAAEARCLAGLPPGLRPALSCAGADSVRAGDCARSLLAEGCTALLSFGIGGGLDPNLPPGQVVIAGRVVGPDGRALATDAVWRDRLAELLMPHLAVRVAAIAGVEGLAATRTAKVDLFRAGAALADMESLGVAREAQAAGVPFLAVRVVADPAQRPVPSWLIRHIAEDGRVRGGQIALRLALRPGDLPLLLRLGRDNRRALAVLRRVVALAGPWLFGL